jgi:ribonuclease Z
MKIPIIFLGTGQAIPTAKRNHTSILLKYKNENLLFDCGEGTQRQFRKAKLNMCKITRIFITHWHGDHILGLPGLFQTLQLNKCPHKIYIYGPKKTEEFVNLMLKLFVNQGKLNIEVKEISSGKVFENSDFLIEALPMKHNAPCLAYSFIEKEKIRIDKKKIAKLKIKGKIIGELANGKDIELQGKKILAKDFTYREKGKKITIILDTAINPNAYLIAKDSDLLICEATYSKKEKELAQEYRHLTAEDAAEIAKKAKVKRLILTHLSQRYEKKLFPIFEEAREIFKNVGVAEDLDKVEI